MLRPQPHRPNTSGFSHAPQRLHLPTSGSAAHLPASSAASPASRPTLPINPLALAAILSPPPFSRPPPSCPAPFFPSRCRNGGCGGGAAALGPGRNGAVGRPRAPHTASVPSRGSVGAGGALVLLLGGGAERCRPRFSSQRPTGTPYRAQSGTLPKWAPIWAPPINRTRLGPPLRL